MPEYRIGRPADEVVADAFEKARQARIDADHAQKQLEADRINARRRRNRQARKQRRINNRRTP
jgi:hypothetical protein